MTTDDMLLYCTLVLPPVLVPRYSEYPSMSPYQQMSEPTLPYNVSFPQNFHRSVGGSSGSSTGPVSPPFGVPGTS